MSNSEIQKNWLTDMQNFISHWEGEAESISQKDLNPDECTKLSNDFRKEWNGLMLRRPMDLSEQEFTTTLKKLDNKLNSNLAIACKSYE